MGEEKFAVSDCIWLSQENFPGRLSIFMGKTDRLAQGLRQALISKAVTI